MRLHLVVHTHGSCLVDGNHHRLANKSASKKVPHNVFCYGFQPVIARNQVVLPPQHFLQLGFLISIQIGIFNNAVDIVVQVRVNKL